MTLAPRRLDLIGMAGRYRSLSASPCYASRQSAPPVADEEAAQVARLTYLASQGAKEFLVAEVSRWPGIHAANNIANGDAIQGIWHDRTHESRQSRCGKKVDPDSVHHLEILELMQLPCWEKLSAEDYQARVAEIVERVDQEAAAKRALEGKSCLGPDRVLRQDPLGAPKKSARSPSPSSMPHPSEPERR